MVYIKTKKESGDIPPGGVMRFKTEGTCAKFIDVEVENGIVKDVKFIGGCSGNTQGIQSLVRGMKVEDVVARLKGIKCGYKSTSCPDQLAICLEKEWQKE